MKRLRQPEVLVMEERYATTMRLPNCMTRWSYACGHKGQADSAHYHSDLEDKRPDLKCGMTFPNSINQIFEDEYRFAMTIKAAKDMVEPFDFMYMGQSRSGVEIHAAVPKSRTLYANSRPRLSQEIRTMEEAFAELSVTSEKAENQGHTATCNPQVPSDNVQCVVDFVAHSTTTYAKGPKDEPVVPRIRSQKTARSRILNSDLIVDELAVLAARMSLHRLRCSRRAPKLPSRLRK